MRLSSDASGWLALKQQGRQCYENGNYEEALEAYQSALASAHPPSQEKQLILSNIVACRLKLLLNAATNDNDATYHQEQARAAVRDAQECVRLNENWAKAHIRLAEAYIAMGGHSNEACNSLQTALRLDPGQTAARQMLVRELRRDHRHASSTNSTSNSTASSSNSSSFRSNNSNSNIGNESFSEDQHPFRAERERAAELDDYASLSWSDRFWFHYGKVLSWYSQQSDTRKSLLRLMGVLLILYVAFGGRFGLEYVMNNNNNTSSYSQASSSSSSSSYHGNYGHGNAYEQYRRRQQEQQSQQQHHYQSYHGDGGGSYYYGRGGQGHGGGSSYHASSSSYGGGGGGYSSFMMDPTTLLIMLGGAFVAHQLGMNPLHALLLVNRFGRRQHVGGGGFGYGGGYGGGGMMGYGFGGAPRHHRPAPRGYH